MNAASLSVVNIAPGSIISIFGTNLTTGVAFADNVQKPPLSLGGVTVTIGSATASLFYTSPTQINAVVNPATPTGAQTLTVTSPMGTQTGSVTIDTNAPPGLFSLFGTGTRDGAILNAVTFVLGDFSTSVANSPTFLALFATGVNTSVTPIVTIGGVPVQVTFAGAAPCCAGLQQINVKLPDSLAGAGRVPVVVTSNGQASNTVQVVLLPPSSARQFPGDQDNQTRSRELASLASVPGSSLVLSVDENDDVVRVVDVSARQVTRVIALPQGANPVGLAVSLVGTRMVVVVAEADRNMAAVFDLNNPTVTEVPVGFGPVSVAIGGTQAVVVNGDADSVSVIDISAVTPVLQKTIPVGRAPVGVAVDATAKLAFVTNESDGSVSVIDLVALAVTKTFSLGAAVRPEQIALGAGVAFIAVPASGPDGQIIELNTSTGATVAFNANPARSGGSSDVIFFNSNLYVANQAGGSVSVIPINAFGSSAATGPITTIKVDLGARALAIDTHDNLLVVSNEGTGTLVLVSLASNAVVGRINAVRANLDDDDGDDDHSDRNGAQNIPVIQLLSPASAKAGSTFTITVTGSKLTGATGLAFVDPLNLPGKGKGRGAHDGEDPHGRPGANDPAFTVTNVQVSAGGTQLTATVAIAATAKLGPRIVRVMTANGESTFKSSATNTFTVVP